MARYGISQAELKRLVHYDPETGVMTRKVATGTAKVGDVLGSAHSAGYLWANVKGDLHLVHRLAWLYSYGEWPDCIDHINHKRTDNRIANLRSVTKGENLRNLRRRAANSTGITGVHWDKARGKWAPKIGVNGRMKNLGRFDDFFEACCVRKSAEVRYGFHENHGRAV